MPQRSIVGLFTLSFSYKLYIPQFNSYRTINGACNNVHHPKWGKAITPYGRIASASFSDGIHEIRKSVIKSESLPPARATTNTITRNTFSCSPQFPANMIGVMYGQLMAHDHGMRQMYQTSRIEIEKFFTVKSLNNICIRFAEDGGFTRSCCNSDYTKPLSKQPFGCQAFVYDKKDPFLAQASPNCNIQCMNYIRSQLTYPNDCMLGAAVAVNRQFFLSYF